jgi:hypothetical protein
VSFARPAVEYENPTFESVRCLIAQQERHRAAAVTSRDLGRRFKRPTARSSVYAQARAQYDAIAAKLSWPASPGDPVDLACHSPLVEASAYPRFGEYDLRLRDGGPARPEEPQPPWRTYQHWRPRRRGPDWRRTWEDSDSSFFTPGSPWRPFHGEPAWDLIGEEVVGWRRVLQPGTSPEALDSPGLALALRAANRAYVGGLEYRQVPPGVRRTLAGFGVHNWADVGRENDRRPARLQPRYERVPFRYSPTPSPPFLVAIAQRSNRTNGGTRRTNGGEPALL